VPKYGIRLPTTVLQKRHPSFPQPEAKTSINIMVALSETFEVVEHRLARLVNEAIKYKFGTNGGDRCIRPDDLVIDPSAGTQTYYFRDEAIYNKGPWKDFLDYNADGSLPPHTTSQKLFQDVDKAIIDGDVIVKLVDTPGEAIDWDDLRGWHYHSPGDNFNDDFKNPRGGNDKDASMKCWVYICNSRGDGGDDSKEDEGVAE
jgi:hypothetical protein